MSPSRERTFSAPMFLLFDDEQAVQIQHVTHFRTLGEQDIDLRTGERLTGIPKDAHTRVDTAGHGFFYTATTFDEIVEQIIMAAAQLSGDDHG